MRQKILVIDEETHTEKLISTSLGEGYEVMGCYSGKEGLSKVEDFKPDMVILDIHFPDGLTGHKVCETLRADGYEKGILFLSAVGTLASKFLAINVGADDYMGKPFDAEELRKRVKSLLPEPK